MSKDLLRLIVVIIIIAVVTTVVYFIINRPDDNKKLYDNYISLIDKDSYQNYDYLTKEFTDTSTNNKVSLVSMSNNLNNHYRLTQAIKLQIEQNLLLINYATKGDDTAQKALHEKMKVYNEKAYGENGVAYQARYLYEYYVEGNYNASTIQGLNDKLLNAMHEMEIAGFDVLIDLDNYVATFVFNSNKPDDLKYVLYDVRALIAGVASSYENSNESGIDELYLNISKYEAYLAKFEQLIISGESNGYKTLINSNLNVFIKSYNLLDKNVIIDLLSAEDKNAFINSQTDETIKKNLTTVLSYLEAKVWVNYLIH